MTSEVFLVECQEPEWIPNVRDGRCKDGLEFRIHGMRSSKQSGENQDHLIEFFRFRLLETSIRLIQNSPELQMVNEGRRRAAVQKRVFRG
jgi:hypothetical protein